MKQVAEGIDWQSVRRSYEKEGWPSLRVIGREYGISHTAVKKRAKAEGWRRAAVSSVSTVTGDDDMETSVETVATIDGTTGKLDPLPSKHRVSLARLRDVRREMATVYLGVKEGALESQDGSRRVFMLRQIADVIVNADIEKRIAQLEEGQPAPVGPDHVRLA